MSAADMLEERPPVVGEPTDRIVGVVVGILIGFENEGRTPLVIYPGQPGDAAIAARATRDVHGAHIGCEVALLFDKGDPKRPILMGCLQRAEGWSAAMGHSRIEVESDGERVIVAAKEQLVLRCGKASITLTKSGKVLIEGAYVSNKSSGVMRIKGGSVQVN